MLESIPKKGTLPVAFEPIFHKPWSLKKAFCHVPGPPLSLGPKGLKNQDPKTNEPVPKETLADARATNHLCFFCEPTCCFCHQRLVCSTKIYQTWSPKDLGRFSVASQKVDIKGLSWDVSPRESPQKLHKDIMTSCWDQKPFQNYYNSNMLSKRAYFWKKVSGCTTQQPSSSGHIVRRNHRHSRWRSNIAPCSWLRRSNRRGGWLRRCLWYALFMAMAKKRYLKNPLKKHYW